MNIENIVFIVVIIIILFLFYLYFKTYDTYKKISQKPECQKTLEDAKKLLDSINVKFHLHSGTALGAIREKDFIKHDHDIDIAVFNYDYKDSVIETMKKKFIFLKKYGSVDNGLELKFVHKEKKINLDIFLIYKKENKFVQSVYHCKSDRFEKGPNVDDECIMYMNNYKPILIEFLGKQYYCAPISFLVDRYGKDWMVPKIFNYFEGLDKNYSVVEKFKKE